MANNYLQPVNDYFSPYGNNNSNGNSGRDLEDVDDETFLSAHFSRLNSNSKKATVNNTNPFEEETDNAYADNGRRIQSLEQSRREIEESTLSSTQKSLNLLYNTEEVGKATAFELSKQREQLERTSRNLDEINATLRFSQRHLNGLKSVFGSLKNYLAGNRDMPSSMANKMNPKRNAVQSPQEAEEDEAAMNKEPNKRYEKSVTQYDNHPISRIRNDSSMHQQRQQMARNGMSPFEAQLEANLEEMCGNLSRLKGLANDMTREIESQNELLDNMNYKIEDVDIKMNKQNKEIRKLLGKK